jgi:hypothetical protein
MPAGWEGPSPGLTIFNYKRTRDAFFAGVGELGTVVRGMAGAEEHGAMLTMGVSSAARFANYIRTPNKPSFNAKLSLASGVRGVVSLVGKAAHRRLGAHRPGRREDRSFEYLTTTSS